MQKSLNTTKEEDAAQKTDSLTLYRVLFLLFPHLADRLLAVTVLSLWFLFL